MDFADMYKDKIELLKADGTKITGLMASVQRNTILMTANDLLVEPQDLIVRKMSNGAEETFRVNDPGFHEEFHGIPASYHMDVQKLGVPEARSAVQNITYNVTGNNARINQNSTDNSTNVVHIDARVTKHIEALREEVKRSELSDTEKADANEVIDEIDLAFHSGSVKKTVIKAMLKGLPHVANIATIVSALIPLIPGAS